MVAEEVLVASRDFRAAAEAELDDILKKAGALHGPLMAQRAYYSSAAQVLNREGLGSPRRASLEQTASKARVVALAGLAQLAVGTGDLELAAVVLAENDLRRESDRAFSGPDFLALLKLEILDKVSQYITIGDNRLQGIVLAVRTWNSGRHNPLDTVQLGLSRRKEDDQALAELRGANVS